MFVPLFIIVVVVAIIHLDRPFFNGLQSTFGSIKFSWVNSQNPLAHFIHYINRKEEEEEEGGREEGVC